MTLSIDIETYSSTDLVKTNVYKYVEAPDFDVLLIGLRYDDGPVRVIDTHDKTPLLGLRQLMADLVDPAVIKTAYNAQFEIVCLAKYFGLELDPAQWRCTMAGAARLGLPFGLDKVAEVLGVGTKKDTRGRALIKYFSVPCKPTAINEGRTRNLPHHSPEKWQQFIDYCARDVEVETAIKKIISFYDVPDFERPMFALDQRINARGVLVDLVLVREAIKINDAYTERMVAEAVALTGLANPNSVAQLRTWLEAETGEEVADLRKERIPGMIAAADGAVRRVLEIRQLISKSSIKKYYAMLNGASADGRVRGLFQYYGANRTGRWAGRQVQMQNLIKNSMPDLDLARRLVRAGDLDTLELVYSSVPGVLSQLIRTAFVAAPGKVLLVSDFSAIEARVIAWLAGEQWRLEVFRGGGKIYEASAAAMFFVEVGEVDKEMRAKGKIAELALGYQGAVGALLKMGALAMGLAEDELPGIVERWRSANKRIVGLWQRAENAARSAVADPGRVVGCGKFIEYQVRQDILFCRLPSGRELAYMRPRLQPGKFGNTQVTYEGLNQTSRKWERQAAYGGLLVENMTQAIARDILAAKMLVLDGEIIGHIHDEIILETGAGRLAEVEAVMAAPVEWAVGLPLGAESFETLYYKKD